MIPQVGSRVQDRDGHRGTVRYVGAVASSKSAEAVYCGVEWDAPSRGKGDGSVVSAADPTGATLVRHFQTACGGGVGGSFMKPELLSAGVAAHEALDERYNDKTAYAGATLESPTGRGQGVPVLLVGDAKIRAQQALAKLATASLRDSLVARVAPESLRELCPRLREVDLRGNLLRAWGDGGVAELGRQLPQLRILSLADNRLEPLTAAIGASLAGAFPQLRTLVLTETGVDWQQASRLDAACPLLEELHLAKNGLARLLPAPGEDGDAAPSADAAAAAAPLSRAEVFSAAAAAIAAGAEPRDDPARGAVAPCFARLKTLNLSDNRALADWGQVYALRGLPALSWLSVNDCGLSDVWSMPLTRAQLLGEAAGDAPAASNAAAAPPPRAPSPLPFARLEHLSLTGCAVASLASVDALDSFPALTTLRLGNADLAACVTVGPSEARQLVVARCPRITMLNGSEVRAREREDAEKAYARKAGAAFAAAEAAAGAAVGAAAAADVTAIFGAKLAPEAAAANPYGAAMQGVFSGGASSLDADAAHIAAQQAAQLAAAAGGGPPGKTTLSVSAPSGFSKGADAGVIRGRAPAVDRASVFVTAPVPLALVGYAAAGAGGAAAPAAPAAPRYEPLLDPWGLGAERPAEAARLQSAFPRYFLLAARYELHAPAVQAAAGAGTLAASVATLTLRSMAGASSFLDPVVKRLPLSMEVGALRQLCAKLFRAPDASLLRLSVRERAAGDMHPTLLDDDLKPLSYFGVPPDGAEVLIEEVNAAEAARQAAAEEERKAARAREQEAQGEAIRRAQEQAVAGMRKGVSAAGGGV